MNASCTFKTVASKHARTRFVSINVSLASNKTVIPTSCCDDKLAPMFLFHTSDLITQTNKLMSQKVIAFLLHKGLDEIEIDYACTPLLSLAKVQSLPTFYLIICSLGWRIPKAQWLV